ncbi:MAG: phage major capsid protein [Vallitaleaceae bacterium]|nr:phage major capsid protein [Vallitaleaceae bacterium]
MKLEQMYARLEDLKVEAVALTEKEDASVEEINAKADEIKDIKAKINATEALENEAKEEIEAKIESGEIKKLDNMKDEDNKMDIRETKNYTEGFYNILAGKSLTAEQKEVFNTIGTANVPVPKSFQNKLVEALENMNIMRKLATVMPTDSDKDIPIVSAKGSAAWTLEDGAYNESDDTFTTITIKAYKLTRIIKVSEEILEDNTIDLEAYLVQSFAKAIAAPEENAFINGSGTNQPQGVFVGATVGKTAASATAITADEIIDLFYSLKRVYRANATFIMNDSTLKAIRKLKDTEGNYLWSKGLSGEPEQILGRPVETSEYAPELATGNKVIAFGDISYYTVADRSARTFQRLNELYSGNGQVGFRGYERVDGKLTLAEAVKVLQMA